MTHLTRSVPFTITRADDDDDGLTLEGYAAVFDSPTRIESWEGSFDEVISPGAFAKTIKERSPVLQFDHGTHPLLGSLPLGKIDRLKEDDEGLHVTARLSDNWLIAPVRDAIRDGAVDGMSFRFSVVREEWDDDDDLETPLRTLKEVKLYELGPVVFPAYDETSVGVRSAELRHLLDDEATRTALAQALISDPPGYVESTGNFVGASTISTADISRTSITNGLTGTSDGSFNQITISPNADQTITFRGDSRDADDVTSRVTKEDIARTIREIDLMTTPKE